MNETQQPPAIQLAQTVVGSLIGLGVTRVAYCPGSRSAPLAYALAAAERAGAVTVETFSDERSAGFWAVGAATGLRDGESLSAVAVMTTSGTAVAELHPAMEEARHRGLPVMAITADRPHELRGVGASQTTEQEGIFGRSAVAWDSLPAEGEYTDERLRQVRARVARLHAAALARGPVHLNVAFREPLVPEGPVGYTPTEVPSVLPSRVQHPRWDRVVDSGLATVVIAGDAADPNVIRGAEARGIAILAEPTVGVRIDTRIPCAPLVLPAIEDRIEQVVVTGRPTLSRPILRLLAREGLRIVVVSAQDPWPDLAGTATVIVHGLQPDTATIWEASARLRTAAAQAADIAQQIIDKEAAFDLLGVCAEIWKASDRAPLWLGASNTVRGFDLAGFGPGPVGAWSNRGLAGIDGTIASAAGLAAARGEPVRAVMGDLTFAADLSTLSGQLEAAPDLQVIVLDDGGGSIFASLEHGQPEFADVFERFFAVPARLDVVSAARACGWASVEITNLTELGEALQVPIRGRSVLWLRLARPADLIRRVAAQILTRGEQK